MKWRFYGSPEDSEAWLRFPSKVQVHVDYERTNGKALEWRRVLVVTKGYLESHLSNIGIDSLRPRWVGLPTMIVLPDAVGSDLKLIVDQVINAESYAVDMFSIPVEVSSEKG